MDFITVGLGVTIFGAIGGILGTFILLRKQKLIGNTISNAVLPVICIMSLIIGTKSTSFILIGVLILGTMASLIIMYINNIPKVKYDNSLGITPSVFFGLGLILITYIQKLQNTNQSMLDKLLFGNVSTLLKIDIKIIGILSILTILSVSLLWKEFKILCFNREFGESLGIPMKRLDSLLICLLILYMIIGVKTVGIILTSVIIIAPAVSARQWTNKLWLMIIISAIFGSISGFIGILINFFVPEISIEPIIVAAMSLIILISISFAPSRGVVWSKIKKRN